jgi:hypothetical protein
MIKQMFSTFTSDRLGRMQREIVDLKARVSSRYKDGFGDARSQAAAIADRLGYEDVRAEIAALKSPEPPPEPPNP